MQAGPSAITGILDQAVSILGDWDGRGETALDGMQTPIYATDLNGVITYFNPACITFAGRVPRLNEDRWCVTWKLYTDDGDALPHEQCPMAVTLKTGQPVRGIHAVAERPDGTRRNFMPFPTPLYGSDGALVGAVNAFLDLTADRQADLFREKAAKCRRWADSLNDREMIEKLAGLAAEYEDKAAALSGGDRAKPFS